LNIQDLGAIGELIAAIATLVTLIYLAVQIRHSKLLLEEHKKLALSAAYQVRTGFRMDLAKDYSMDESWLTLQAKLRGGHQFESPRFLRRLFCLSHAAMADSVSC